MHQGSCGRSTRQDILDAYKSKVMHNDTIVPEEAWNWLVEWLIAKNDDSVRLFHKFGCGMGPCDQCPKWNTTIQALEKQCNEPI
jgi:hypothetical protein